MRLSLVIVWANRRQLLPSTVGSRLPSTRIGTEYLSDRVARRPGWQERWTNRIIPASEPCPILGMSGQVHFPELDDDPNLDSPRSYLPPARRPFPSARDLAIMGDMATRVFASITATAFGLFPRHCGLGPHIPVSPCAPARAQRNPPSKVLHPGDMSRPMETP